MTKSVAIQLICVVQMNVDTNDEIDDLLIITEGLFALSPEDLSENTVGTLLNHDSIGWEKLSRSKTRLHPNG